MTVRASLYSDKTIESKNPPQTIKGVGNRIAPTGFQHISLPSLKISSLILLKFLRLDENKIITPVKYQKVEQTDRNRKMCQRYKQGDTLYEIARDYNISIARVHQIISK